MSQSPENEYHMPSPKKSPMKKQDSMMSCSGERLSRDMFESISKLGEGSFAKVYLVKKKGEESLFALKQLDKVKILKIDKVESVHRERDILMQARHPNIVHLDCTFSDDRHLYFLMEYAENRSLSELLKLISK